MNQTATSTKQQLSRKLSLLGLTATGICSMFGASIYIVPFMIQRNVPGIGPYVLPAFLFAAIPAIMAALAYAALASAMPRAGGSYIFASRGLNPYLGFIASFSQWFGLSIVIGVIGYVIVPFLRDIAIGLEWEALAIFLETSAGRLGLALSLIWVFIYVNIRGATFYERTLIPMMFIMFGLGIIVMIVGFAHSPEDFAQGLQAAEGRTLPELVPAQFDWWIFLSAAPLLFSSFIGFDSIAQAGGEAKNPTQSLPRAIGLAIGIVGSFYFIFTAAVYNTVPWNFVAQEAMVKDISAPGLLAYILPTGLAIAILAGAAIALVNDLPAMLLSVSRLMFAWAMDGIFPEQVARIHSKHQTPHIALILSGIIASIGVLGCHFAGDFFLGVDIMVTSMMVNFLLMCVTLIYINRKPEFAKDVQVIQSAQIRAVVGWLGAILLISFLIMHTWKDLTADVAAWYFRSTPVWLIVMGLGSVIFWWKMREMKEMGKNPKEIFEKLPEE